MTARKWAVVSSPEWSTADQKGRKSTKPTSIIFAKGVQIYGHRVYGQIGYMVNHLCGQFFWTKLWTIHPISTVFTFQKYLPKEQKKRGFNFIKRSLHPPPSKADIICREQSKTILSSLLQWRLCEIKGRINCELYKVLFGSVPKQIITVLLHAPNKTELESASDRSRLTFWSRATSHDINWLSQLRIATGVFIIIRVEWESEWAWPPAQTSSIWRNYYYTIETSGHLLLLSAPNHISSDMRLSWRTTRLSHLQTWDGILRQGLCETITLYVPSPHCLLDKLR